MTPRESVYNDRLRAAGIPIHDFAPRRKVERRAIREIRRVLEMHAFDIAYLFNNKAIANAVWAARRLPVKLVTYRGQTGNIRRIDPSSYLTHLHPRVDAIICVSDAVRDDLRPQTRIPDRVVRVYKGHDLAWYDDDPADLSQFGIPSDAFMVGVVANRRPRKGFEYVVASAEHLARDSGVRFLLVGRGTDDADLREMAKRFPDRFFHAGFRRDAPALIAACQASLLAAVKGEGLPKSVIESMAVAVPPIATTTGGSPELIVDGESGLLIPPRDAPAIAEAASRLAHDRAAARAMGERARERIATHFNIADSVRETIAVFQSLLANEPMPL